MAVCCARRSCFQEARTLFRESEDGISSFNTTLESKTEGFALFQPLLLGLRKNQWEGPGTGRVVLLGKREGLRSHGARRILA